MKITVNLFAFVFWPIALGLCYTGLVSWWTLLLIALYGLRFDITWKKG